ncbi:MAG: formylglycine-generating enzyme family protein [Verrucomicrobiales bacterium]|nr:formylglycine-generating enzyme family protein [Verrucomicrobiales bacterium]
MGQLLKTPCPLRAETLRTGTPLAAATPLLAAVMLLSAGCGPDSSADRPSPSAAETVSAPGGVGQVIDATDAPPSPSGSNGMVFIPGGTFVMGDADEIDAPPHEVTISAFFVDPHPVTQEEFESLMGSNPSRWKGPKNPVEQLRWSDAARFCNQRSEREGLAPCYDPETWHCDFEASGYRLPTEAEWEYACRAGTTTAYFFGDSGAKLGDYGWYDKNAGGHPRPVGQKEPNPWGLYDMAGNVWEWCNDYYAVDYYAAAPARDPRGPEEGTTKVLRGGAWRFSADNCRSGYRYNENPGEADVCFGYDIYGFRCVRRAIEDGAR